MHWTLFLFALIGLVVAHVLRVSNRGSLVGGTLAFAVGFVAMAAVIRMTTGAADLTRPTDFDAFVEAGVDAVNADPTRPYVIFVGASFARNALDDAYLTEALAARGYPHLAVNLSLEGASLQERNTYLQQFINRTNRIPDVVVLGVEQEFDIAPTYIFNTSKFSDRAIEQVTPRNALWSAFGLLGGGCSGAVDCVKNWGFLGVHFAMNLGNLGLLSTGQPIDTIEARPSYDPQTEPRSEVGATERQSGLSRTPALTPASALSWASGFRKLQREKLMKVGVGAIGYFFPPVIDADVRAYSANICAGELADYTCIAPTDPALLTALDGEHWFDDQHLLASGAAIYTEWLADQIDQSELLK